MSDIPVGSPPAPPGRHAAPGGWYPDPVNVAQERYWDGWQWSRTTRPGPGAPSAGYGQAPYAPYPQPNATQPVGYAAARAGSVQATTTADGVALASWWWRVLAVLIDGVILTAIVAVITFPVWRSLYATMISYVNATLDAQQSGVALPSPLVATDLISGTSQLIVASVTLVVGILYHAGFLRWKSATPGKLICGLRVVPVDRGRDPGPSCLGLDRHPCRILGASRHQLVPTPVHSRGCALPTLEPKATGSARHCREDTGGTTSLTAGVKSVTVSVAKNQNGLKITMHMTILSRGRSVRGAPIRNLRARGPGPMRVLCCVRFCAQPSPWRDSSHGWSWRQCRFRQTPKSLTAH